MIKNTLINESIDLTAAEKHSKVRLPQVRFPLRAKITVPFLILAVGLAIGAAFAITQIVFDTIDERFTNQLIESGKLAAEGMVRQEDSLLRSLRLLSYAEGIPQAIADNDINRLQDLSYGIAANQGEEVVDFLDKDGQAVLSLIHQRGGDAADYEFSTSSEFDYTSVPFIRNVLEERVDDYGDKYSGLMQYLSLIHI